MRKDRAINSLIYKLLESGSVQVFNFVFGIILARLLSTNEFGVYSVLLIFVSLGQTIVQGGLSTALIQKKIVEEADYSTIFTGSIFISGVVYVVIFCCAPIIAEVYRNSEIVLPLRVVSIVLFPGAMSSVQVAKVARRMDFRIASRATVISTCVAGIVGLIMAAKGLGIWSLVAQQVMTFSLQPILLSLMIKWKPQIAFEWVRFKSFFQYGSKILITSILRAIYADIQGMIVGIRFSTSTLAYYSKGQMFPRTIMNTIDGSFQSVLFPVYSEMQDDKEQIINSIKTSLRMVGFFVYPLLIGLFIVADNLITVLLTEKWCECIPFMRIYCVAYLLWPLDSINLQTMKALGKSNLYLVSDVVKKCLSLLIISLPLFFSSNVQVFALTAIAISITDTCVNSIVMKRLIGVTLFEELGCISKSMLCSILMLPVLLLNNIIHNSLLQLIVDIVVGALIYIVTSFLLNKGSFIQVTNSLRKARKSQVQIETQKRT